MTEQRNTVSTRRARRVRMLKKMIILSIALGILIPTVLCIFLLIKVVHLENRLDELSRNTVAMQTGSQPVKERLSGADNRVPEVLEDSSFSEQGDGSPLDTVDVSLPEEAGESDGREQQNVKKVHLTFDDGPSIYTDDILDVLREYDVKATFFVNGREDENSLAMYRRIVEEGHTLGMHSYTHKYGEVYASKEAFIEDTLRLQKLLAETTGVTPMLYRFPGGSSNHVSSANINDLIDWLNGQGIAYFDWNISSGDSTSGGLSAQQIVNNCTNTIPNHEEPVILMHDSGAKRTTVEALPLVIEKIQAMEGVEITAITEDTEPVHHVR